MTTQLTPRVATSVDGTIARITIGNGQRRNALTPHDWSELRAAITDLGKRDDLAIAVVRGAGATFSSGADIEHWHGASEREVEHSFELMEAAFAAIEHAPFPVLAVVEGVAAGAGCELALACDIQIAARSARLGMPIARLGILLSPGFAARLMARVGPSRTLEMIYSGSLLPAPDAAAAGVISSVVEDSELDQHVEHFVGQVVQVPLCATRAAKTAVNALLHPLRESAALATGLRAVDFDEFTVGVERFVRGN